jgi:hypothetical protein|tara:strand:- start:509 stop:820 length:312 start_codon:yes stop_codon:yes gene_type:complete
MTDVDSKEARTDSVVDDMLREGVTEVKFTKKDGTDRVMLCTKAIFLIPEKAFGDNVDYHDRNESMRPRNIDVAVVWDLQKDAWRSFRYDSVQSASSKDLPVQY